MSFKDENAKKAYLEIRDVHELDQKHPERLVLGSKMKEIPFFSREISADALTLRESDREDKGPKSTMTWK
jgi:hypothetical protein